MPLFAHRLVLRLATSVALVLATPASASEPSPPPTAEPEPLVVQLRLAGHVVDEGLPALADGDRLLLPLGAVARALDLAVTVDAAAGAASGWVLDPSRPLSVDAATGLIRAAGRTLTFDPGTARAEPDDLYLPADVLERVLPVRFTLNPRDLAVVAAPSEPLPLQRRLERERRWSRLSAAPGTTLGAEHDVLQPDHALFSLPFIDAEVSGALGGEGDLVAHHRALPQSSRYSVRGAGDLLGMGAEWYVTGNARDPLSSARLRLSRKDPRGGLLGPLDARDVSLGDVVSPTLPLLTRPWPGLGVQVSSFPLTRPDAFDRTTLHGDLPEGWEVELYRNGSLLDFRRGDASGRYLFTDVPLLFGRNVLRLDFHGPHGERRSEERLVLVGPGMIRPGEAHYRLTTQAQNRDLLPVRDDDRGARPLTDDLRATAELEVGLSQHLSAGAVVGVAPTALIGDPDPRAFGSAGLRAVLPGAYGRVDLLGTGEGGFGARAELQTELAGLNLVAEHAQLFGDFVTEAVPYHSDPLRMRSRLRLDGRLPLPRSVRQSVPVALTLENDGFDSGRQRSRAALRVSTAFGRLIASHEASIFADDLRDPTASAMASVRHRSERFAIGADFLYGTGHDSWLQGWQVRSELRLPLDLTARALVRHQRLGSDAFTASAGVGRRHGAFAWSVDGGWDSRDGAALGLTLGASFGYDAESGASIMTGETKLASHGAVSARVYHDRDLDGRFSPGDVPLDGALLELDGVPVRTRPSGPDGATLVTGLRPHAFTHVRLSSGSLEDPFLRVEAAPKRVLARPGRVAHLDIPVVMTGEVTGRVLSRLGPDEPRPVAGVPVALVDREGRQVATTRTAFDGWYVFAAVRPGDYRVKVDDAAARARALAPGEVPVSVEAEGGLASAHDVALAAVHPLTEADLLREEAPPAQAEREAAASAGAPTDGPAEAPDGAEGEPRRAVRAPAGVQPEARPEIQPESKPEPARRKRRPAARRPRPTPPPSARPAEADPAATRRRVAQACALAGLCPGRPVVVDLVLPVVVPLLAIDPKAVTAAPAPAERPASPRPATRRPAAPGPDPRLYAPEVPRVRVAP